MREALNFIVVAAVAAALLGGGYLLARTSGLIGAITPRTSESYSPPPLEARLRVQVDRAYTTRVGQPRATVAVTNTTALYVDAFVQCVFLNAGRVTATGSSGPINSIPPQQTVREDFGSGDLNVQFDTVECRIDLARQSS